MSVPFGAVLKAYMSIRELFNANCFVLPLPLKNSLPSEKFLSVWRTPTVGREAKGAISKMSVSPLE